MSETLVDASWYLGRGTGVAALVLFTAVVVAGILVRRVRGSAPGPRHGVTAHSRTTATPQNLGDP